MTNREAINIITVKMDVHQAVFGHPVDEPLKTAYETAISALEKQEQDRWVPVSERPKKDGRYQVTRLDYVTDTKFIDNLWYEKNTWWNRQATGDYAVTAWRPLPAPYQEDEA